MVACMWDLYRSSNKPLKRLLYFGQSPSEGLPGTVGSRPLLHNFESDLTGLLAGFRGKIYCRTKYVLVNIVHPEVHFFVL